VLPGLAIGLGNALAGFGTRTELAALLFTLGVGFDVARIFDMAVATDQIRVVQPALGHFHIVRIQVGADFIQVGQIVFNVLTFLTAFLGVAKDIQRTTAQNHADGPES